MSWKNLLQAGCYVYMRTNFSGIFFASNATAICQIPAMLCSGPSFFSSLFLAEKKTQRFLLPRSFAGRDLQQVGLGHSPQKEGETAREEEAQPRLRVCTEQF